MTARKRVAFLLLISLAMAVASIVPPPIFARPSTHAVEHSGEGAGTPRKTSVPAASLSRGISPDWWEQGQEQPRIIPLLITISDWAAEGDQAKAYFGSSVGAAGDVNGDGYGDIVVGADFYDNGEQDEGRAFVFLGSATGLSNTPDWTAEGNQEEAHFGSAVSTAGDVNGDGYDDIIVGAYVYDDGETDEGRAYVYYGSATGLSTSPNWTAEGDAIMAYFGFSVGTAGDVNGDGYDDIVVGEPGYSDVQGQVLVFHGSADGPSSTADWSDASGQIYSFFGGSVGTAGDINGDGYDDIIVGAYAYDHGETNEGRAYVYHGSSGGLSFSPDWITEGEQEDAQYGRSVGTAGDVNGDGYDDVIVGAHQYDSGQVEEGRAFIYYGSTTGVSDTSGWTAESDLANTGFGYSVGTAGDVNVDGYDEVIIGARYYDHDQQDEGRVDIYYGSATGPFSMAGWTSESDQQEAYLGDAVGSAGDVNGDGYADVIFSADRYDNRQQDVGRVTVHHGLVADKPNAGLTVINDGPTPLGLATTLTATVTSGTNISFNWALGDGDNDSGAVVTHTYPTVGVYTAAVTASNSLSQIAATTTVSVTRPIFYSYLPRLLR